MKQDVRTNVIPPLKFGEKFGFLTFSTASNVVYQFKSIYYLFFIICSNHLFTSPFFSISFYISFLSFLV